MSPKRLTQRDLARRAKLTAAYVAMLETGARKSPSVAILKRLAKALEVQVADLDRKTTGMECWLYTMIEDEGWNLALPR